MWEVQINTFTDDTKNDVNSEAGFLKLHQLIDQLGRK